MVQGKIILNARTSNVCGAHQHIEQTAVVPIVSVAIPFFLSFLLFFLPRSHRWYQAILMDDC